MSATHQPRGPTSAVAFLVQRIGPYHEARLRALGSHLRPPLCVVEFRPADLVYQWETVADSGSYRRIRLSGPMELEPALREINPSAIICVGYSDPEIQRAIGWGLRHRRPLIVCSDSNHDDEVRRPTREWFKRRLLSAFEAALVAGSQAEAYLVGLGLDRAACFRPWDVVDNAHFERGAAAARADARSCRTALKLPAEYFFCSARFVPKKNLLRLLDGYRYYADQAGARAWPLVLAGSGPMEPALKERAANPALGGRVHFVGFVQYPELPAFYGLAGALVLPSMSDQWGLVVNEAMAAGLPVLVSRRCGCAPELIREGENGFLFDPEDSTAIAQALSLLAGTPPERRTAFGRRSQELISAYTPAAFAAGLAAAVSRAQTRPPRRRFWAPLVAGALARRRVPAS